MLVPLKLQCDYCEAAMCNHQHVVCYTLLPDATRLQHATCSRTSKMKQQVDVACCILLWRCTCDITAM